ncbi:hypothetical protein [Flavobacterium phragmitis]|uniref:Uncharacterized protein n=1 Tax=Flavobacterium phragmitis TaxID=739143 RepID=A0A1I1SEE5_9FLAO|nr:hypothetical protein [Flavobacterium phragmitis]SFD44702.1 hypothetical protein SAMN05216297_1088 [Flavobacterium phragmitis]
MKNYFKIAGLVLFSAHCMAQTGIINNNPDKNAVVDLNPGGSITNTKGLRLPNVKLKSTDLPAPLSTHVSGMMVYNNATDGTSLKQVTPGVYCNDGTQWIRVDSGNSLWGLSGNYDTAPATDFIGTTDAVDFVTRTNNTERMRVTAAGKTLVGTTTVPTGGANSKLIIAGSTTGALQIKDGTQGTKKALTSDANGVGTWQSQTSSNLTKQPFSTISGISIPATLTSGSYIYTGSYITLGPGKWLVSANILLTKYSVMTNSVESWWVRSSFSDSSTALDFSPDIVGGKLISGVLPPSCGYSFLNGSIIINNTSGANKKYYYMACWVNTVNGVGTIEKFAASVFEENYITSQKIQ